MFHLPTILFGVSNKNAKLTHSLSLQHKQVEVEFAITGTGHLFGDGMGIFFTNQRAQEGPVFGSQDKFEGLGVFIDTYKNNRPGTVFPYVMAMIGDGKTAYDKDNDGKANELAGCSVRLPPSLIFSPVLITRTILTSLPRRAVSATPNTRPRSASRTLPRKC